MRIALILAAFTFASTAFSQSPFGIKRTVALVDGASGMHASDLDGDGDIDLLTSGYDNDEISWHENDGTGLSFETHILSSNALRAESVYASDLDGDGDLDIAAANAGTDSWGNYSAIATYENLGGGLFDSARIVSSSVTWAQAVHAADLDGDGLPELISASYGDDKIAVYRNLGGDFGPQEIIGYGDGATSVFAADIDGDGDRDLIAASRLDDRVAWYQNDGSGNFGSANVLSTSADAAFEVFAADMDNDGDLDVLSASFYDDEITLYENLGTGFDSPRILSHDDGAKGLFAGDLDGDGDQDVLTGGHISDAVHWLENLPGGCCSSANLISGGANGVETVYAADMDGDGDPDAISASYWDDEISWYENRMGFGVAAFNDISSTGLDQNVFVPVLDNDLALASIMDSATLEIVQEPNFGSALVLTDAEHLDYHIFYDPQADFIGTDSLIYVVCNTGLRCDSATVKIEVGLSTGLSGSHQISEPLTLFPNPAVSTIKVIGSGDFMILNSTGQVVVQEEIIQTGTIDVSELSGGWYLAILENIEGVHRSRFIKK